ncbi:hypothetical protein SAMN06265349_102887 [Flavobacterium resistens]|uniref:Uncharacterized protein n=1 Tax=Flavobacterium resistens TaxID=443612 RepID=A0A521CT36_9FLAO|nr:hypothetical protein [Flavobacterium resistens]MRX66957.1 hypothetical protein [Flavobacterium resistens]SMO62647.1 hypothetical protein SAMN06265349_102887 [Flavobacterium resistens]
MSNDYISSFFDNIKDKTTNPFFGTLIFVWLVRNWDLVYTIFNFDSDCTLLDKKDFIRNYYAEKVAWQEIGYNIIIAFGVMLLSYGLIIISRLVVNVTNHNIIPRMNEKTVSKLVVNKNRFETVKKTRDEYFIRIQEIEEQVVTLEQKNTLLKKQNIEDTERINGLNKTIERHESNSIESMSKISDFKSKLDDTEKDLAFSKIVLLKSEETIKKNNKDLTDLYNLIFGFLDQKFETLKVSPYQEFDIPLEIKDVYSNLHKNSSDLQDFDAVFFDVGRHLTGETKDRASFISHYIDKYIDLGLVANNGKNEKHKGLGGNLELTALGSIVFNSQELYELFKEFNII